MLGPMAISDSPLASAPEEPTAAAPDTGRRATGAVLDVCPYLRVEAGSWRSVHASRDHRCGAMEPAAQVSAAKQRALCLVPAHATCATYLAAARAAGTPDGPDAESAELWPQTRSAPVVLEASRGLLAPLTGGSSRTGGQALLVGLMVVAFVVLVVARASGPGASGSAGPGVSPSPAASSAASPATTPSPAVTPSPEPSPAPTLQPSPGSTITPTAAPTPIANQTYTVKSGDTLSAIAARFGTTVAALAAANNITDTRIIHPGQVLVIP